MFTDVYVFFHYTVYFAVLALCAERLIVIITPGSFVVEGAYVPTPFLHDNFVGEFYGHAVKAKRHC